MADPRVFQLKRNDLKGALALAKELIESGNYDKYTAEALLKLQDNPDKLIDQINELLDEG